MRLKKLSLIWFSLSLTTIACAGTMGGIDTNNWTPKESFYAGVGFGGSFNSDTVTVTSYDTKNSTFNSANPGQVVGNVYIGYGHTWVEKYFLGIEANTYFPGHTDNINTSGVSAGNTLNTYTTQFTFKDYMGLDLLPGMRFENHMLVYARTGLSFRDIEISQNATITPSSEGFYSAGHSVGGRFGVGAAYDLTRNIGVAVDYFYTYFPTWSAYWSTYNLQQQMTSHQNYIGISLVYTS
ncbi:MAG: hypothetical protein EBQ95_00925 [Gammaproteobacteria bacterium]|nr:hypothetical protein [Gammaproteobacteria bacterium]